MNVLPTYGALAQVTLRQASAQGHYDMLLGFARMDHAALKRYWLAYRQVRSEAARHDVRAIMARRMANYETNLARAAHIARIAGVIS